MFAAGRRKIEYRMSDDVYPPVAAPEATRECRMMKFGLFSGFLRRSTFLIRYSAVYPPLAGSVLNVFANKTEVKI